MPAAKCAICGKTAYPLESVNAIEKTYHKGCFKCEICKLTLTLSNYKGLEGKVYCGLHVPKVKATQVVDSVAMKHAQNAPRKDAEALGKVQKGTGGKPTIQVFGADGSGAAPAEDGQPQEQPAEEQPQEQPAEEQPQEQPAEEQPQEQPAEEQPQEETY